MDYLVFRQLVELSIPTALRKRAGVLVQETEQEIGRAIGHVDNVRYPAPENVIGPEETGLGWEIDVDRLLDAQVEELRMWRGVKKAVEIRCLVEHADVAARRWLPPDQRQQAC